jgi:tetratricopeptide (TPR) repeat protein
LRQRTQPVMAKKQQPTKPVTIRTAPTSAKSTPAISNQPGTSIWLQVLIALVVTTACYWSSLSNDLVNWDDDQNITENVNLIPVGMKGQNWNQTFSDIFSLEKGNVIGNYNPLPILSFAVEKAWMKDDFGPKFVRRVHTDNLILHLLVVLFAMRVLMLLGIGRWGVLIGGLLMGIHPMRVESVAWATERKDVLFAMFFFASLECYIHYAKASANTKKWVFFALSMLLAVLSLYSKVQAVTLVVSMVVVDYWLKRKWTLSTWLEKVPLFAASVAMGLANIYTLNAQGSTKDDITGFNLLDRACIATWSFSVYLFKLVIPYPMSPLYPYPKPLNWFIYASPVVFAAVMYAVYWLWRNNRREWVFGFLFFFLNVAPVLQFFGAGQGYLADRFTYVPYFGFFTIAAWAYERSRTDPGKGLLYNIGFGVILAGFALMTFNQIKIWKNGETLWTHVMKFENDPKSGKGSNSLPYWNRGQYLRKLGQTKKALEDYSTAVMIDPKNPELYNSRGKTYFDMAGNGKLSPQESTEYLQRALKDYDSAASFASSKPKVMAEILINRGAAKGMAGDNAQAMADLSKGIQLDPKNKNGYFNRSIVYFNTNQFDLAIKDYSDYLVFDPDNANILYERGMLYRTTKNYPQAIQDLSKAITIKPDFGLAYIERARAKALSGNKAAAEADYRSAKTYGQNLAPLDNQLLAQ